MCSLALVSQSWSGMTNRREACITFQRMTRAQLPPSEYNILRQLFQKLISGLSNAKDVHEAICAILRRHNATELDRGVQHARESGPVLYVRSSAQVVHVQYVFDTGIRTGVRRYYLGLTCGRAATGMQAL